MSQTRIHVLVQIKSKSALQPLTKATVIGQAQALYSKAYVEDLKREFARAEKLDAEAGDDWHAQRILNRFESRRGCLSNFMSEVKERITSTGTMRGLDAI